MPFYRNIDLGLCFQSLGKLAQSKLPFIIKNNTTTAEQ